MVGACRVAFFIKKVNKLQNLLAYVEKVSQKTCQYCAGKDPNQ
jgi:hypothetical protein